MATHPEPPPSPDPAAQQRPDDMALAMKMIGLPVLWAAGLFLAWIIYEQHVCLPSSFMCFNVSTSTMACWFAGLLGLPGLVTTTALTKGPTSRRVTLGLAVGATVTALAVLLAA